MTSVQKNYWQVVEVSVCWDSRLPLRTNAINSRPTYLERPKHQIKKVGHGAQSMRIFYWQKQAMKLETVLMLSVIIAVGVMKRSSECRQTPERTNGLRFAR